MDSMRSRGMRDVLPDEMRRFRRVEEAFRSSCLGWGYEEVRTPVLEHLHLFTSAGTLSPQMLGRVYSFLDWDGWSGERVVLRPDSTIPSVRLYVEAHDGSAVAKLFYVQNVFRFAEGDESREDWQCGVELIGDSQPQGDVELVLLGREVLGALGLHPDVRLSHTGLLRAVLARTGLDQTKRHALYDRILDGDDSALAELKDRLPDMGASLEALLAVEGEGLAYLENLRSLAGGLPEIERPLDELAVVVEALEALSARCLISAAMVRNFEYYTGPAFQFEVEGRRVGGGGRYDGLVSLIGGREVPASGFALEAGLLAGMLPSRGASAIAPATIVARDAEGGSLAAAFRLAVALREQGVAVQVAGAAPEGPHVAVSGEGYVLSGAGGEERRLGSVEEVAEALRLAAQVRD